MKEYIWWILGIALVVGLFIAAWFTPSSSADLSGGNTYVLRVECEGGDPKAEAEEAVAILYRRLDAPGIRRRVVMKANEEGGVFVHAEVAGFTLEDEEAIVELLTAQGDLKFCAVHAGNDELVSQLFGRGAASPNLPLGYKAGLLEREAFDGSTYSIDVLTPWTKTEWEEPENQKRLQAALKGNTLGLTADAIGSPGPPWALKPAFKEWLHGRLTRHISAKDAELFLESEANDEGLEAYSPVFVEFRNRMGRNPVKQARMEMNPYSGLEILLWFNDRDRFCEVSGELAPGGRDSIDNQPRRLAILLDDQMLTSPNINEPICEGVASITGGFSRKEAWRLTRLIDSKSLPCRLRLDHVVPIPEEE